MRFAVLTGDLIASSKFSPAKLDAAMAALGDAVEHIGGWQDSIVTGFARRGGDGWQCALSAPRLSLRAALYLRASLRHLGKDHATRIAIAEGEGILPADRDPNGAHGPGFIDSGRLLEALPSRTGMAHDAGGALGAAVRLADHISQGWTPAQARATALMLPPPDRSRADAAKSLGITRQAINQALWAAGYPALEEALALIENDHAAG